MQSNSKIAIAGIAAIVVILSVSATLVLPQPPAPYNNNNVSYIPKRILTLQTGQTAIPEAEATASCGQSLSAIDASAGFHVLAPTVLPQGYSLKYADYSPPGTVYMKFSDGDICGGNAIKLRDGVLEVAAMPLISISDARTGEQYTKDEAQKFDAAGSINATTYKFANGMFAIGYDAGVGTSRAIDENNVIVHSEQFDYASSVWVVDDGSGTVYRLQAFVPLEDLVKITESLK